MLSLLLLAQGVWWIYDGDLSSSFLVTVSSKMIDPTLAKAPAFQPVNSCHMLFLKTRLRRHGTASAHVSWDTLRYLFTELQQREKNAVLS